ncbi:MAG: VOC family protein [Burkholderiales bacterium]|nr:VOC family protein [Burkholderiales bacterium]
MKTIKPAPKQWTLLHASIALFMFLTVLAPAAEAQQPKTEKSTMANLRLNWFEIPTQDFARALQFYRAVLGTEIKAQEMGGIRLGMIPLQKGQPGGALSSNPALKPGGDGTVVFLGVDADLSEYLVRIERAGGKVLVGKTPLGPNMGHFCLFMDSEGNRLGLQGP